MATYDEVFGGLHSSGQLAAPKRPFGAPPGDGGGGAGSKGKPKPKKLRTAKPQKPGRPQHGHPETQPQPTPADKVPPAPGSLGIPGLPPDLEAQVASILAAHAGDPNAASYAIGFLKGTPWFKATYPGFDAGVATGLWAGGNDLGSFASAIGNYNGWHSQIINIFNQNYGRPPSAAELAGFAGKGFGVGQVQTIGAGHAFAQANQNDIQYLFGAFGNGQLTPEQLQALGEQNSGGQSALGQSLNTKFQQAIQKMQRLFEGTLASPSLSLGSGGLSAPSLNPNQSPDIGA